MITTDHGCQLLLCVLLALTALVQRGQRPRTGVYQTLFMVTGVKLVKDMLDST